MIETILADFGLTAVFWAVVKIAAALLISYAVARALREKPPDVAAAGLDDLKLPTPQIGRHFPVIFGTPPRDRGPFLFWYGHLVTYEGEEDDAHVCWYYVYSLHFGLCHTGIDGLIQIWVGDKCVWPTMEDPTDYAADGQATATVDHTIQAFNLFGSYMKEGGYSGTSHVLYGESAQAQNSYLVAQLGAGIPNFRGIVSVVMQENYLGVSAYPKIPSFVCKATDLLTDGTSQWYSAKSAVNTYGLNPAHIIRQALTDTTWGARRDAAEMGTSFTTVADTLYDEGFGLNYRYYPEPGNLPKFIDEVLNTIDGYLYQDHINGTFEIGLCRGDYVVGSLDAFDESDFEIVGFERPSPGDVPARVILSYRDRSWPDQRPHAIYDDIALQARQGDATVEQEVDMAGICDADLANMVVNRLGRATAFFGARLRLKCKQTMRNLRWGSVFKISYDDPDLAITQMVLRVARINYGTIRDHTIEIDAVEDVYGTAETVCGAPPASSWTRPTATTPQAKHDLHSISAAGTAALVDELYSVSSASASVSASPSVSPSASISSSPSVSPSASISSSPSASISASPSVSVSASISSSVSSSPS